MLFVFDEGLALMKARLAKLGIDIPALRASGALQVERIDAAEMSPGEFAQKVRDSVVERGVVIDHMTGFQAAMP